MKTWPINIKVPKYGVCQVKEMTDREATWARKRNINWAPRSMGFVNLFKNEKFVSWCGVAYAKRRLIDKKAKLPKYIRDVPL